MYDIPDGCDNTIEHALVHVESALDSMRERDYDQVLHDLHLVNDILSNVLEIENHPDATNG